MPPEYRKLYYKNAGYYANNNYNVVDRYQYKSYDTTSTALTVVERFNWRCETYYKNGKRNGIYKKYTNNKLSVCGIYTNGRPTGIWYFFLPSGEIRIALKHIRPAPKNPHQYKYIADIYSRANGVENYYLDSGLSVYLDEQMNLHYDE